MDLKVCTKCNVSKSKTIEFFYFRKKRNSFENPCKDCHNISTWKYKEKNKEKILSKAEEYRAKNKLSINIKRRGKYKLSQALYKNANKTEIDSYKRDYKKNLYSSNIEYKLHHNFSVIVRQSIKKDSLSIVKFLPYSINDLKNHLENQFESWMSWSNWGLYNPSVWNDNDSSTWTWQIDHIIPQSDLQYYSMEDVNFKECWSLDNLRPLSAKINCIEGATRVRHKKYNT